MTGYLIRRLVHSVIVLIIVTLMVFFMMRLVPGDPILLLIPDESGVVSDEQIAALRHKYGIDRPVMMQYLYWISNVVRGDLGTSILHNLSVADQISARLPITVHLGLLAFVISIFIGIPLGVVSAVRRGSWLDTVLTLFANFGITVPIFWLGIMMVYVFGLYLNVLPVFGYTSPFQDLWLNTKQIIMPVICLSIFAVASGARQTRSSMLEVMQQDYIRTAWSKGLKEWVIVARHALKNGLIPVLTLKGMTLRNIIGGSVLIETVFNIPGMGRLAVDGLMARDYPIVQGVVLIIAIAVIITNLMIDLSYGWLDPRIKYK